MQVKTIEVEIKLTPEEIATEFCNMCDYGQVRFFIEIANIVNSWPAPFDKQLIAIISNPEITNNACRIMQKIGEYGEAGLDI